MLRNNDPNISNIIVLLKNYSRHNIFTIKSRIFVKLEIFNVEVMLTSMLHKCIESIYS